MCHIAIFGRQRGAKRLNNATLRSRAARAATPGGLQAMWEERMAQCSVKGKRPASRRAPPAASDRLEPEDEEDGDAVEEPDAPAPSSEEGLSPAVPRLTPSSRR